MKVLITGGAGFIGSHLSDALLAADHEVIVLDDLSTGRQSNLALAARNPRFRFVQGDVRDQAAVDSAMERCDAVVHLAARIGMRVVVESPLETMDVNGHGTQRVLESASRHGAKAVIASTSEVYGHSTKIPSAEDDPICFGAPTIGRWSYACSKAYDEFLALAMHRERDLPVCVIRLFNTVGTRQTGRYGMVIPRFVDQALAGIPLSVYGDGLQTRCFCSVHDVVSGLMTLLERMNAVSGELFNLGNPVELSILELAKRVIEITGSSSTIDFVSFREVFPEGFEEIMRRVPDISKARKLLDFDPKIKLDTILEGVAAGAKEVAAAV
ncbi:MAG: SDR family NAD(P)-dependent oxidoreductase [Candidatus Baltobacteraceae bacterium]